jgi:hypothetical protein
VQEIQTNEMKYELAKQLKDMGFPQNPVGRQGQLNAAQFMENEKIELCYFPTLSELIEACGDGFKNLDRDTTTEELFWLCNNYFEKEGEVSTSMTEGKTPEEAVANLWLALNKK